MIDPEHDHPGGFAEHPSDPTTSVVHPLGWKRITRRAPDCFSGVFGGSGDFVGGWSGVFADSIDVGRSRLGAPQHKLIKSPG
jgi:hypothetical protein